jgi:hypothetical protein
VKAQSSSIHQKVEHDEGHPTAADIKNAGACYTGPTSHSHLHAIIVLGIPANNNGGLYC